jgi:hypothetical protein
MGTAATEVPVRCSACLMGVCYLQRWTFETIDCTNVVIANVELMSCYVLFVQCGSLIESNIWVRNERGFNGFNAVGHPARTYQAHQRFVSY